MDTVVDLHRWRREREAPDTPLGAAVARLDRAVARFRGADASVATELLAIHGCLALGLLDEAAGRAQRLAARLEARRTG